MAASAYPRGALNWAGGRLARYSRTLSINTSVVRPCFTAFSLSHARSRYICDREMPVVRLTLATVAVIAPCGSREGRDIAVTP